MVGRGILHYFNESFTRSSKSDKVRRTHYILRFYDYNWEDTSTIELLFPEGIFSRNSVFRHWHGA